MKKIKNILILLLLIISFSSCKSKIIVKDLAIEHELEFGGIYLKMEIDDFNNNGFSYGDSVDISFTNDYRIEDIPYYNGYYVDAGETLLVGYPGYDYIKLTLNYGDDYWNIAKVNEDDKATISLNEKGKYKDIQTTMNIQYKDERNFYTSDTEFANYRMISNGKIKNDILFRGASPCDNKHNRAHYVDELISSDNIGFIVNLADTDEKIKSYIEKDDFNSPYFLSLYRKKAFMLAAIAHEKVVPLAMNMNYKSDEFRQKVADGFKQMLSFDGPYYIHCQEGKDRTGFVCIVIEALCGATYKELVDDYMLTYDNYYKITLENDELRYNVIKTRNVDAMLKFLVGDEFAQLEKIDFVPFIKDYLINGGMTLDEINNLIQLLTK